MKWMNLDTVSISMKLKSLYSIQYERSFMNIFFSGAPLFVLADAILELSCMLSLRCDLEKQTSANK